MRKVFVLLAAGIVVTAAMGMLARLGTDGDVGKAPSALRMAVLSGHDAASAAISRVSPRTRALLFPAFFVFAAACLRFRDRRHVATIYLCGFLLLFTFFGGVAGQTIWPFSSWFLYADATPETSTYYELRVVDDTGKSLKYDERALSLTNATPLHRMAAAMATAHSAEQNSELAAFFLAKADAYRRNVEENRSSRLDLIRFPRHQFGFSWTSGKLAGYTRFVNVAVYRVSVRLSRDGRAVQERSDELVGLY